MTKQTKIALAAVVLALSIGGIFAYHKWTVASASPRDEMLAVMPAEANAVFFFDVAELRSSLFLKQLYAWAPKPQADPDYAQFIKDTGFDYERDLDGIAVAVFKNTIHPTFFAAASGRFNQQKISAYALQHGKWNMLTNDTKFFIVPSSDGSGQIQFAFPRKQQIIITNDNLRTQLLQDALHLDAMRGEWHQHFERLAGSPVFAVIRQDAALGATLSARTPGGLRSPQLSSLLDQLQWITLAGKPDNDRLRVVAEGESSESTVRQLADVLNGVLILAEGGLNDAKMRQQLDPAMRAAYLELLKSADVSKIDRGDSKSVRLVFDLTPGLLEAARKAPAAPPDTAPVKPLPKKAPASRNGRT